ncbi:hypothetical protein [Solidesulfovibrio sp.]
MATQPIFPGTIKNGGVSIANADAATKKVLYTAPASGVRVDQIRVCSNDTAAVVLAFALTISAVDYPLGEVLVPAGAGTDGSTLWVDALGSLNNDQPLFLASGSVLKVNAKVAVTAGKTVSVTLFGGDF